MLVWAKRHPVLMRRLARTWLAFAHLSGVLMLSGLISYALVLSTVGEGDVWEASDFRLITPEVKMNGTVTFIITVTPNESCPGEVVTTLINRAEKPSPVVERRRRVVRPGVTLKDQAFSVDLTPEITPGTWDVDWGIDSTCANRRKFDPLAHFQVVVTL